jgi:hypothetical protein
MWDWCIGFERVSDEMGYREEIWGSYDWCMSMIQTQWL